jgi:hypothetical protein
MGKKKERSKKRARYNFRHREYEKKRRVLGTGDKVVQPLQACESTNPTTEKTIFSFELQQRKSGLTCFNY